MLTMSAAPLGQHAFGHLRGIDPVRGDERHADLAHELLRHPGEGRARHRGGDGRHPRLVPADPGIEERGARGLDGARERAAPRRRSSRPARGRSSTGGRSG